MKSISAILLENLRNRRRKSELDNSNFTIISSNCIGGVIYHKLGLKFLSPTINLWFKPKDYLKFLNNLDYYLTSADLKEDIHINLNYPVGALGDGAKKVTLYFQHYQTFNQACKKWNSRKTRVNFKNIFIIMTDRDGVDEEALREFDRLPFKNKVILTGKKYPEIKSSLYIPNCLDNNHLGDVFQKNFLTGKSKLDSFDFIGFLNGNGNRIRN